MDGYDDEEIQEVLQNMADRQRARRPAQLIPGTDIEQYPEREPQIRSDPRALYRLGYPEPPGRQNRDRDYPPEIQNRYVPPPTVPRTAINRGRELLPQVGDQLPMRPFRHAERGNPINDGGIQDPPVRGQIRRRDGDVEAPGAQLREFDQGRYPIERPVPIPPPKVVRPAHRIDRRELMRLPAVRDFYRRRDEDNEMWRQQGYEVDDDDDDRDAALVAEMYQEQLFDRNDEDDPALVDNAPQRQAPPPPPPPKKAPAPPPKRAAPPPRRAPNRAQIPRPGQPGNPDGRARNSAGQVNNNRTWVVTLRAQNPPFFDAQGNLIDRTGIDPSTGQRYVVFYTNTGAPVYLDYMCGQMEEGRAPGPGNNGIHWQGYLEFSADVNAWDIMQFFGWAPGTVHLEPRYGTQDQAIGYTMKEETRLEGVENAWMEVGTKHAPNAAGAWNAVQQRVLNGGNMMDFLTGDAQSFRMAIQFQAGIRNAIAELENTEGDDALRDVKVIVYYGEPRTGKTGTIYRRHKFKDIFVRGTAAAQHYTAYRKQPVLVFNEIGSPDCHVTTSDMQTALDPYPLLINAKYTQHRARWTTVYICSNIHPQMWFPKADATVRQSIQERIHEVWRFTKDEIILEKGPGDFPPIPDPAVPNQPRIVRQPTAPALPIERPPERTVEEPAKTKQQADLERVFEDMRSICEKNPNINLQNLFAFGGLPLPV